MLDLVIKGGTLVDGNYDAKLHLADVGVEGDRIAAVGNLGRAGAKRVLDASGAFVCPGLIDPHSHSDWSVLANPTAESTIRQGVTTEVVGNCGVTYAPLSDASAVAVTRELAAIGYGEPVRWRSFADLLDVVRDLGTSQNLAWMVGHSAVRDAVGVRSGEPDSSDLAAMNRMISEAMDAGALGMSSGLEYGSGREARTEELVALAGTLRRSGGLYASHIRNRDADLIDATNEFFRIARAAGGWAQLSHLNVRQNTGAPADGWHRAVQMLADERDRGLQVLADMTPFPDGLGLAAGLLPQWFLQEDPGRAAVMLGDSAVRDRLRVDCDRYWRFVHRGEWSRVTLQNSPATPEWEGLPIPEIARRTGRDEWDCFFDILAAAGPQLTGVGLVAQLFTEEHVAEAIAHPLFCLGADAFTSRTDSALADRSRHPLFFAGHTHYLSHHVRDEGTLSLATAVHKMTGMVADQFGLAGRGRIVPGFRADLMVADLNGLSENATVERPLVYSTGVQHVVVNGVSVIDDGEHTGARPGRYLPRNH